MRLNRDLPKLKDRKTEVSETVENAVRGILADVRANGDAAVKKYAAKFDGFTNADFLVSEAEINEALNNVGDNFLRILNRAKTQIEEFHAKQAEKTWGLYKDNGVIMGQIVRPLQRVGLYVPGGTAAYPSTVLMNAVPAMLAQVEDIAVFTPEIGRAHV